MCAKRRLPAQATSPDEFFMTDAGIMTVAIFEKGMELGKDLTFLEFMDDPMKVKFFKEYYFSMATIALRKSIHTINPIFVVAIFFLGISAKLSRIYQQILFSRLKIKELWIDFTAYIKERIWISA